MLFSELCTFSCLVWYLGHGHGQSQPGFFWAFIGIAINRNVLPNRYVGGWVFKESASVCKQWRDVSDASALAALASAATGNVDAQWRYLIMIAACSWTLMGVITKRLRPLQALRSTCGGMLFAPVPLVLFAACWYFGDQIIWQDRQWIERRRLRCHFAYPTTMPFGYWVGISC